MVLDDVSVRLGSADSLVRVSLTESQRLKEILKQEMKAQSRRLVRRLVVEEEKRSDLLISFRTREESGVLFNSTDSKGITLLSVS